MDEANILRSSCIADDMIKLLSAHEEGKVTVEEFNMDHRVKDELIVQKIVETIWKLKL